MLERDKWGAGVRSGAIEKGPWFNFKKEGSGVGVGGLGWKDQRGYGKTIFGVIKQGGA